MHQLRLRNQANGVEGVKNNESDCFVVFQCPQLFLQLRG